MIIFEITPMAKPRMTRRDRWAKRPVVLRYFDYKNELRLLAFEKGLILGQELHLLFVIPMPQSWSQKKRSTMVGAAHTQTPDIDNLVKGVMDCLLSQDKAVHTLSTKKIWGSYGSIHFYKNSWFLKESYAI